jgi:glycosyltransferase involved in cell wall biosynthesis
MTATMSPRATVIIPTYNWSTVLPFSIGSVLDQTFDDFELLVVGDGCTDDSAAVVAGIGDRRVRWIEAPRTGHQSGPNNEGLRQAKGDLIAYLGHDDLWLPHHLASAVRAIDDGADVVSVLVLMVSPPRENYLLTPSARDPGMPPSAVVHRRQAAEAVGGWRDYRELSIDPERDLWRRMRGAGFRMAIVPRLGVVKFPAAHRHDVYRTRPCHEQAAWLARIRTEPALEAEELSRAAIAGREPHPDHPVTKLVRRAVRPFNPRYWLYRWRTDRGRHIKAAQRFKGVTPAERTR